MKKKKISIFALLLLCVVFLGYGDEGSNAPILNKSVIEIKSDKSIKINDMLACLVEIGNMSVIFESNENPFDKEISLEKKAYTIADIINKLCNIKPGIFYSQSSQIISLKDKSLCGQEGYSLDRPLTIPVHIDPGLTSLGKDSEIIFVDPEESTKGIPEEIRKAIIEDMKKERQKIIEERARVENIQKRRRELERLQVQMDNFLKLRIALEKQRFFFRGMPAEWMLGIEKYNGKTIREAIVDIISKNKLCCWIYEIRGEEKDRLLKENEQAVKDLRDANRENYIDEGMLELLKPGPIYGVEIYKADYDPGEFDEVTEEAFVKPEEEAPSISDAPVSNNGKQLLKMSSIFSKKKNSLTVTIENVSARKMNFHSLKDDFIILELYDDERGDLNERAIYAGKKTELPAPFSLAPGESKTFEFKFNGVRFKEKYGRPFLIKEAGTENQLRLDKVPFQELSDLGARIETFYPIIYFDLDGKKYKSSGEEAMMMQE